MAGRDIASRAVEAAFVAAGTGKGRKRRSGSRMRNRTEE
jgi:hypothetical protein